MKIVRMCALAALLASLFLTQGCVFTRGVLHRAEPHSEWNSETKQYDKQVEGQPAYYILVPFAMAGDVVAFPVYAVAWYAAMWHETHNEK